MEYRSGEIEPKWQRIWSEARSFRTSEDPRDWKGREKYYILDMFPYPSGAGLHVGHPEGYTATDVIARMKRMQGRLVLHPMGWDAFGLPAERAAVRENLHPSVITKRNVDNFRKQIQRLGFSYDWEREVDTSSEETYRWTQWIFLKLHERGLAYLDEVNVNWCPALGTVLANEEVKDGRYVETGDVVEKRVMKQWMLKITAYAERLLEDLDGLDWPEGIKEMQRNWIGKSHGAEVRFGLKGRTDSFPVFTTRPDTLMGCSYCVLAPEHPLVETITAADRKAEVAAYVAEVKNKNVLARTDLAKTKTGVFTGACAVHPITGEDVPIWIAEYVIWGYGTGAIMAVPAHDERDWEFAKAFDLPIRPVVGRPDGKPLPTDVPFCEEGVAIHSGFLDGLPTAKATAAMIERLEKDGKGKGVVQYRLRDWLFSRQRYWGEPFPVIHLDDGTVLPVGENELPVRLPDLADFRPTEDGRPPLARAPESWSKVTLPDGRTGTREFNTMPQWAGSCWYYLRYLDPKNAKSPFSAEAEKFWMPVDLYVGGVEHAVLHLLYARFWHKVLFDAGLVSTKEPFQKLFNQGMILAYSYRDARGKYWAPEDCEEKAGAWVLRATGEKVERQIEKMSKSKLNVVNPDDVVAQYGADSLRLYELFMGPLEMVKPWQMDGVEGVSRFLHRVWRLVVGPEGGLSSKVADVPAESEAALHKTLHKTIRKVQEDTDALRFNTAISQMMIFVNEAIAAKTLPKAILLDFLAVLCPYAPHLAEELNQMLGGPAILSVSGWPVVRPELLVDSVVTWAVQVNGKMRGKVEMAAGLAEAEVVATALNDEGVKRHVEGKKVVKTIVVPGKLVNVVVAP